MPFSVFRFYLFFLSCGSSVKYATCNVLRASICKWHAPKSRQHIWAVLNRWSILDILDSYPACCCCCCWPRSCYRYNWLIKSWPRQQFTHTRTHSHPHTHAAWDSCRFADKVEQKVVAAKKLLQQIFWTFLLLVLLFLLLLFLLLLLLLLLSCVFRFYFAYSCSSLTYELNSHVAHLSSCQLAQDSLVDALPATHPHTQTVAHMHAALDRYVITYMGTWKVSYKVRKSWRNP